jgi:hypothetical protein
MALYLLSAATTPLPAGERALLLVEPLDEASATAYLAAGYISAVGHQETAKALSELLGIPVPANRIEVKLLPQDRAVRMRMRARVPEGKLLTVAELQKIGFDLDLLTRLQ